MLSGTADVLAAPEDVAMQVGARGPAGSRNRSGLYMGFGNIPFLDFCLCNELHAPPSHTLCTTREWFCVQSRQQRLWYRAEQQYGLGI